MQWFTGVDPISDQFPHVTTYNYAENEPIAHIDLWGLQKAKRDPMFRANGHAAITAGEYGYEVKLLGSRVGLSASIASEDFIGASYEYNDIDGGEVSGTYMFDGDETTFGLSGGDVFGGALETTVNSETGEKSSSATVNLGLFYIKVESEKESADADPVTNTYLGVEFGVSAGFVYGIDLSGSAEVNLTPDPDNFDPSLYDDSSNTIAPGDNTKVNQVIPIVDLSEIQDGG